MRYSSEKDHLAEEPRPRARLLGLQLLLVAALLDREVLDPWIGAGGGLEALAVPLLQGLRTVAAFAGALWLVDLVRLRPRRGWRRVMSCLALALLVAALGSNLREPGPLNLEQEQRIAAEFESLERHERFRLGLTERRLAELNATLFNLQVPSGHYAEVFAPEVEVSDLGPRRPKPLRVLTGIATAEYGWQVGRDPYLATRSELDLLRPFLDRVTYLEPGSHFALGSGTFTRADGSEWEVESELQALAKLDDGTRCQARGRIALRWRLDPALDPANEKHFFDVDAWAIDGFYVLEFETFETAQALFQEELAQAIPDPLARTAARRNIAQEQIVDLLQATEEGHERNSPHAHWSAEATWQQPGASVVDWNGDGWDDFYVTARYGRNLFFENRGDGTFEEAAERLGLDFVDHTAASLFADFDNDGDPDVFIGRTLHPSRFLENDGGRFVDRTREHFDEELPHFAVTACAADYDRDGLLDLFIGTHASGPLDRELAERGAAGSQGNTLLADFLPEEQARVLWERALGSSDDVPHRVGPPNVLLRNVGGGLLERVEETALAQYRNTFQASFADYDEDGDADLYVANDGAPSSLFQNREGRFRDTTQEAAAGNLGYGTGVSWGDFDRDGDQDLYLASRHSPTGRRVLDALPDLDRSLLRFVNGSALLTLHSGSFERTSNTRQKDLAAVERAAWSAGSHWVDVDNDGWLDLLALAGHYTPPEEVRFGADVESFYWRGLARSRLPERTLGLLPNVRFDGPPLRSPRRPLGGGQLDHLFWNEGGERFVDLGLLTGLADPGDGRTACHLDYDRDGWIDLLVIQANAPTVQLHRNQAAALLPQAKGANMIALRFVGGNRTAQPSTEWTARDGFGALVEIDTGQWPLVREHRAGDGRAAQHTSQLVVGVGSAPAQEIFVTWPSGRQHEYGEVPHGSLVTVYENPLDSPDGEHFVVEPYLREPAAVSQARTVPEEIPQRLQLTSPPGDAQPHIRLWVAMNTVSRECLRVQKQLAHLRATFDAGELALYGVSTKLDETPYDLRDYVKLEKPVYRVLDEMLPEERAALRDHVAAQCNGDLVPTSVATNPAGRVLETYCGIPSVSELRRLLAR